MASKPIIGKLFDRFCSYIFASLKLGSRCFNQVGQSRLEGGAIEEGV